MKHITIIIFILLVSCKNETQMENGIDKSVSDIWDNFTNSNPKFKNDKLPESDYFHDNKEDANRLAELTVSGEKTASSGLYYLYKTYEVDLPKVGTKQIITDFDGKALAIIENKKVDTIPFNKISIDYAEMDMGTKIEPLKKWKTAHWDFFKSVMEESGEKLTEEMLVVCVTFETIWTKK